METLADTFKKALKTIEDEKSPEAILEFFGEDATLKRLTDKVYEGKSGAETFWNEYLETFRTQQTTFNATHVSDAAVVLEWRSEGDLPDGNPFSYRGVSILEADANEVKAFRTYYDSAAFVEDV